ncbi:MAG: hypothetical protein LBD10_12455 [Desulfobulbus sp.]|jgi:hypothetical protein|uniref:hypothetical protein n=1 Tax=Desulfobulbus sp. TaxID=895 RepID=UPI002847F28F|nr:hypothetical protein [Desulfobulbus sp.]MDR2551000.1 hypothetical protein [Desulfobulbus sp.]
MSVDSFEAKFSNIAAINEIKIDEPMVCIVRERIRWRREQKAACHCGNFHPGDTTLANLEMGLKPLPGAGDLCPPACKKSCHRFRLAADKTGTCCGFIPMNAMGTGMSLIPIQIPARPRSDAFGALPAPRLSVILLLPKVSP